MNVITGLAGIAAGLVSHLGTAGVLMGMILESAGVPLSSEVIVPLGVLASNDVQGAGAVVTAGTIGNVIGSWIGYGVGVAIRRGWRGGRWLRRPHWEAAERWFNRYGDRAVLLGRLVPTVRTYISFPAGAASMPAGRFTVYTAIGSLIWCAPLATTG